MRIKRICVPCMMLLILVGAANSCATEEDQSAELVTAVAGIVGENGAVRNESLQQRTEVKDDDNNYLVEYEACLPDLPQKMKTPTKDIIGGKMQFSVPPPAGPKEFKARKKHVVDMVFTAMGYDLEVYNYGGKVPPKTYLPYHKIVLPAINKVVEQCRKQVSQDIKKLEHNPKALAYEKKCKALGGSCYYLINHYPVTRHCMDVLISAEYPKKPQPADGAANAFVEKKAPGSVAYRPMMRREMSDYELKHSCVDIPEEKDTPK